MRNLKRALSLTLASVMLLGMMVVGASAASYTDVDDKDNVEAIEVLNAVEVMIGRQGNFEPDEAVNRHEMAVIMAKLYLGVEAADNYVGSHPFTDVVSWADKYVAACYENGLVAGTSATTFSGSNPLTAVEAAAMMLRALGYENLSKGAANWSTPVTAKANEIRLFAGVASSPKEKLTRNQVAQLALNTLQSTMVTAKGGNDIQIGDVIIPDDMEYTVRIAEKDSVGRAIDAKYHTGTSATGATGYTLELGEHLYNGNLRKAETTDDFGRPATRWTYKTNEVGVYVDTSSVYKSWTAKVAKNELYDLLGGGNVGKLSLVSAIDSDKSNQLIVYVDGVVKTDKAVKEYIDRDNTGASGGYAGKGVLTEVFQDSNNNVTLTFANTYLMQATADYSESNKSVRVTVLTHPIGKTVSENVLKSEDFDGLEGIKEDDYILYTYANGDIQSGQVATVVTGEVTAFSSATKTFGDAGGSVTLDSEKRDYAKYAEVDATNGCAVEYKLGANASIVLDAYGYVIYVDDSSLSVGNYVFINAVAPQTGLKSKFLADAIFTDGTRDSIVVREIKAGGYSNLANDTYIKDRIGADEKYATTTVGVGGWYAYSKNSSSEYSLVKAATSTVFTNNYDSNNDAAADCLKIESDKLSIGGQVTGDKNTIFVVLGKNDKVTVYTGVANVPDVTGATAANSFYLLNKDTAGKNASAVFIYAKDGSVRSGNSDLLYLLNLDGSEKNKGNTTEDIVYTWNVVMVKDGVVEKTQIKTTDGTWAKKIAYKSYGIDSNNFYDLTSEDELTNTYPATGDDVKVENIPASAISCDGETFAWGGNKYIVNADSTKGTALVVYPGAKGSSTASDALRAEVNMDEDASYKVYTGWSGKQIANLFRNWYATGSVYAVLDAKTDRVESMIVVVDGISKTADNGLTITLDDKGLDIDGTVTDDGKVTLTDGRRTGGITPFALTNGKLYFHKGYTYTVTLNGKTTLTATCADEGKLVIDTKLTAGKHTMEITENVKLGTADVTPMQAGTSGTKTTVAIAATAPVGQYIYEDTKGNLVAKVEVKADGTAAVTLPTGKTAADFEIKVGNNVATPTGTGSDLTVSGITPEKTYTVTVTPNEKVTVTTDPATLTGLKKDTKVTLTVAVKDADKDEIKSVKAGTQTLTKNADGKYELTVTADVTVTIETQAKGAVVEVGDTVKAEIADGGAVTFYSYKGTALKDEEIIPVLKAAIDKKEGRTSDKVEIGENGTTVTATFGTKTTTYTITKAGNETAGASDAPTALYKVTMGTKAVYVAENGYIEGLKNGDNYINATTPITTSKGTVSGGKLQFATALKTAANADGSQVYDVELVQAVAWNNAKADAGAAGMINAQGKVSFNGKETVATLTTASQYVAVGAKLTLLVNGVEAGKSVTYLVNDTKVVATNGGSTTANVQLGTAPIEVTLKNGAFTLAQDTSFQIKLNGEFVPNTTTGTNDWANETTTFKVSKDLTGMSVFVKTTGFEEGLNVLSNTNLQGAITAGAFESEITIPTGATKAGVVELYTGYVVGKPDADYVISAVQKPNASLDTVIQNSNTDGGFVTCKPGETPTLYVIAKAASTVTNKAAAADAKIVDFTEIVKPVYEATKTGAGDMTEDTTKTVKGVYSFKVKGGVTFGTEFDVKDYSTAPTVAYTNGAVKATVTAATPWVKADVTFKYEPEEGKTSFAAKPEGTAPSNGSSAWDLTLGGEAIAEDSSKQGTLTVTVKHEGIKYTITMDIKGGS